MQFVAEYVSKPLAFRLRDGISTPRPLRAERSNETVAGKTPERRGAKFRSDKHGQKYHRRKVSIVLKRLGVAVLERDLRAVVEWFDTSARFGVNCETSRSLDFGLRHRGRNRVPAWSLVSWDCLIVASQVSSLLVSAGAVRPSYFRTWRSFLRGASRPCGGRRLGCRPLPRPA
jgi:hypothetical protein